MVCGLLFMSLSLIFLGPLSGLFAKGDAEFAGMIAEVYRLEALGAIPLGVNAAVMGMLYGFGKTKITLFMNFCRVFVFRIPVLWALQQFTNLGNVSVGIVMVVSNVCSGILAAVIAAIEIRKICRSQGIKFMPDRKLLFRRKSDSDSRADSEENSEDKDRFVK